MPASVLPAYVPRKYVLKNKQKQCHKKFLCDTTLSFTKTAYDTKGEKDL
jgi:hypothetical protein